VFFSHHLGVMLSIAPRERQDIVDGVLVNIGSRIGHCAPRKKEELPTGGHQLGWMTSNHFPLPWALCPCQDDFTFACHSPIQITKMYSERGVGEPTRRITIPFLSITISRKANLFKSLTSPDN
jgi:hypothetical protein